MLGVQAWEAELSGWLEPFLDALGHKARRRWAPVYIRGLFGRTERKSVQPMAAELTPGDYDQLHNFIASPSWDGSALEPVLAATAEALVGGPGAVLVIDDTALPKKGTQSVGVAPQYAGALGKNANCQVLVSLTLARDEVPVPVALRLFLPKDWTADPGRCARAGVPPEATEPKPKADLALAEVDRLRGLGMRFDCALADAGYGVSAAFRQGLSARGLAWAVGVTRIQKVYPADVRLEWPQASRGRPRELPQPSVEPVAAETVLAARRWRRITWRDGTKGPLTAAFAACRVRVADGPEVRIGDKTGQHLPGEEEVWLVGERRASGERKHYLSNLPAETPLRVLAGRIKARWVCEQAHQQMKEELGLDHFEGRSWAGLHHHALMVMIAYAFLQHLRLAAVAARGKNVALPRRPAPGADAPRRAGRRRQGSRRGDRPNMSTMRGPHPSPTTCLVLPK